MSAAFDSTIQTRCHHSHRPARILAAVSHQAAQGIHRDRMRTALRWSATLLFVAAGLNHFRNPVFYRQIVPPGLPEPDLLVAISGVCEVAGGIGMLIPPLRKWAGWGLIGLLVAVFPANIFMAMHPEQIPGLQIPPWLLWLRLPLQPVLIIGVWFATRGQPGLPSPCAVRPLVMPRWIRRRLNVRRYGSESCTRSADEWPPC
jgi:uncharacterized membrane protein